MMSRLYGLRHKAAGTRHKAAGTRHKHLSVSGSRSLCILLVALLVGVSFSGVAWAGEMQVAGRQVERDVAYGPARAQGSTPVFLILKPEEGATPTATLSQEDRLQQLSDELDVAWNAQDWPEVLRIIDEMMVINADYDDIRNKKYDAHVAYGYQLMTEGKCTESLAQFRAALALKPDGQEALTALELLTRYCATPIPGTPTSTPAPPTTATPVAVSTATPNPQTTPVTYTVQLGDTLYSLAKRYGTSIQAIMQANGMMSYFLRAGEVIWIPASGGPPPGPVVHIVQPGETLYSIANDYHTTVWAIMTANNLSSYSVWAYAALFVPSAAQPGAFIHIVQPGETLYTIATNHGTTVALIMMANGLRAYDIYVYQRIVIPPDGWTGWPPISCWTGPGGTFYGGSIYVVQLGDTLYSIAHKFGTTVASLMATNGLTSSTIIAGTTLRIP